MIHQLILFKFCNKVILETENVKIGTKKTNAGVKAKNAQEKCAMEMVLKMVMVMVVKVVVIK